MIIQDSRFKIAAIAQTPKPQTLIYRGLHQCVSRESEAPKISESRCGIVAVDRLLAGGRGHWSPLEHPTLSLQCTGWPFSVVAQLTRHRHCSFSVLSQRYSVHCSHMSDIEDFIYVRPVGVYVDRDSNKYLYEKDLRQIDLELALELYEHYLYKIDNGCPPEQARGLVPYDFRTAFIMTCNLRTALYIIHLRGKKDAQPEIQTFAYHLSDIIKSWVPEIWGWFEASPHNHKSGL